MACFHALATPSGTHEIRANGNVASEPPDSGDVKIDRDRAGSGKHDQRCLQPTLAQHGGAESRGKPAQI